MTTAIELETRTDFHQCLPRARREVRELRVALAGCGAVGSALLREIAERSPALAACHGVRVRLAGVLVRDVTRPRDAHLDRGLLTGSVDDFLARDADVVIEAIGGIDPALRIARSALGRGRRLVTANKALLAQHGSSLARLATERGATMRYGAAVGGGVPVLSLLQHALGAAAPARVRGILNGTSNFVLTALEGGASLDEALEVARARGFAEADATRDLSGRDAADKIALVAWAAFGVAPETLQVRVSSLLPQPERFTRLAGHLGGRVRQVAECATSRYGVVASVEPVIVGPHSALGQTRDEGNHVELFAGWSQPLCASGPGAGGAPTATALLSDLLAGDAPVQGRSARAAASDDCRGDWAVEVAGGPDILHRVARSGRAYTDAAARWSWTIVEQATAAEIGTVASRLGDAGRQPIVARLDESLRDGREVVS